jgi:hypothetical protein
MGMDTMLESLCGETLGELAIEVANHPFFSTKILSNSHQSLQSLLKNHHFSPVISTIHHLSPLMWLKQCHKPTIPQTPF